MSLCHCQHQFDDWLASTLRLPLQCDIVFVEESQVADVTANYWIFWYAALTTLRQCIVTQLIIGHSCQCMRKQLLLNIEHNKGKWNIWVLSFPKKSVSIFHQQVSEFMKSSIILPTSTPFSTQLDVIILTYPLFDIECTILHQYLDHLQCHCPPSQHLHHHQCPSCDQGMDH